MLTEIVYLFCKFQFGSDALWTALESTVQRKLSNLSIEELSKIALALVMNHRPMSEEITKALFSQILIKMDKADSKDAFYLSMALGRGLDRKFDSD